MEHGWRLTLDACRSLAFYAGSGAESAGADAETGAETGAATAMSVGAATCVRCLDR